MNWNEPIVYVSPLGTVILIAAIGLVAAIIYLAQDIKSEKKGRGAR